MAPSEIFKHCLTCRKPTLHARVAGIPSRLLYACTAGCKTPAREVSEPEQGDEPSAVVKEMHHRALERSIERQQKQADAKPPAKKRRKETPMPKPPKPAAPSNPLLAAIDQRVRQQLEALLPELLPKVLTGLLGGVPTVPAEGGECQRPVHKLRYGKPCCEKAA